MSSKGAFVSGLLDLFWPLSCPVCSLYHEPPDDTWIRVHGRPTVHRHCFEGLAPRRQFGPINANSDGVVYALLDDTPQWFGVLHRIKYGAELPLLAPWARALADALHESFEDPAAAVIVPVPDDRSRLRSRGFSVPHRIAATLASRLEAELRPDLLRRKRSASSQTKQVDDVARRHNVESIFGVGRLCEISERRLLVLVDDQITSGATVRAAASVLRQRGHGCIVVGLARAERAPLTLFP